MYDKFSCIWVFFYYLYDLNCITVKFPPRKKNHIIGTSMSAPW